MSDRPTKLKSNPLDPSDVEVVNVVPITMADTASVDAFGRQRVSNTETLFDSKQLYDSQPLFWLVFVPDTNNTTFAASVTWRELL